MRVIRAEVLGMCFGVRDALKVIAAIDHPQSVTIHGELVHNEVVLDDLKARGFRQISEAERGRPVETIDLLVTAHGISDRERGRLQAEGKRLIDTTCPLVRRAHEAALKLRDEGRHMLVIGKPGHVEVIGFVEDLPSFDVLQTETDVVAYPFDRLGIICQTTCTDRQVDRIRSAIIRKNPEADIRFIDTICLPTKEHQRAMERLIDEVDAVVVVGGSRSNNTRALLERARERGLPAIQVQEAADLSADWFQHDWTVGLTAGTSTLDSTIDEVHQVLTVIAERLEPAGVRS